jgi:hypothetical protein
VLLQQGFRFLPIRPSVETTNGVKVRRCSRHPRYFFFSPRELPRPGVFGEIALASVSVTRTSMMQSVPRVQRPRILTSPRVSPRFLQVAGNCGLILTAGQLACINGSLRTADGTIALEARPPSLISWRDHISALHSACRTLNFWPQPSQ